MSSLDFRRVRAVVRKELRDYRRKRSIVVTMAVLPLVFLLQPVLSVFLIANNSSPSTLRQILVLPLLYLLLIPTIMPSTDNGVSAETHPGCPCSATSVCMCR